MALQPKPPHRGALQARHKSKGTGSMTVPVVTAPDILSSTTKHTYQEHQNERSK
jgi:hypothetical protein